MSRYSQLVARAFDENILLSVLLELTYSCNLDCFFCYNDLELQGQPLSRQQYFDLFEGLRDIGTLTVTLSGGEPLAHPDFFALGARLRELGFVVRIKSNGHALHGAMLDRILAEIDPYIIEISLHGATAATHDRQTRVPGSFDRLLRNLRGMRERGMRLQLNSTLTAWNEDEMEAMFALADGLELPLRFDPSVTPRDDGDLEPQRISASAEGIARLYRLQPQRAERLAGATADAASERNAAKQPATRRYCGAGASSITIDPFGNVYPCVQWRTPVGNLHERPVKDIWLGSTQLDQIRAQTEAVQGMVEQLGGDSRKAGFCPGLAAKSQGVATRLDPFTRQRMQILAGEQAAAAVIPSVVLGTPGKGRDQ